MEVFSVIKAALGDIWEDVWSAALFSVLWALSVVLILPAAPATLALFYYANRRAHGEPAGFKEIGFGLRRYWKAAYRWGLLNLAVVFLLGGDHWLAGRFLGEASFLRNAQGFYLAALGIWAFLQLYTLPFLLEQEAPAVGVALRNAVVMFGRNPGFSLALAALLAALLALGTLLFMLSVAVGGCFLACAANRAVLNRLALDGLSAARRPSRPL